MYVGKRKVNHIAQVDTDTTRSKTRAEHLELRNSYVVHRYYFFKSMSLSYEAIIDILSEEFCLSALQLGRVIVDNTDKLREITTNQPTEQQLINVARHFNWNKKYYTKIFINKQ